jgi:large subunit ribosomal protein L1
MAEDKNKTSGERQSRQTIAKRLAEKRKDPKKHSARYLALEAKLGDAAVKPQPLADAINLVKETATTKFDGSVELHIHLTPKKGKKGVEDELMRGMINLPNGLGKTRKVVILNEDLIEEIAKTEKVNFDIALATPAMMPKLGRIAKILGTKGKMPNPKAGTVTDNPEAVKQEIEAGRVEYRQDRGRNIHQMIGKSSWEADELIGNAEAVLKAIPKNRIESLTVTTTMGPSVKVAVA